ncbi:MAG: hypothetical protein QXN62_00730 [Candidatus Bathyarchaeia archaeon]|nr:hypothetical protein [Candidatus Bathyarchaeota archaeon]
MYLKSRDIAAVATCSALWASLNITINPIFFQVTRMPFLCDLIGFILLSLVVWWTRKPGAASLTGLLVAALTLIVRPGAFHMLGFVAASILFDLLTMRVGYNRIFGSYRKYSILIVISIACAWVAGLIIGNFFMNFKTIYAILFFSGLHALGGLIGGIVGAVLIQALTIRKVQTIFAETSVGS